MNYKMVGIRPETYAKLTKAMADKMNTTGKSSTRDEIINDAIDALNEVKSAKESA